MSYWQGLPGGARPGMPEHGSIGDRLNRLERAVHTLSSATPMRSTSLDGGTFRVKNGGTIQLVNDSGDVVAELDKDSQTFFDSNGDPLTVLDGTGLTVGDAPVVLDSDGLDIANGLVIVDALGLAVGTDVEIDSAGLKIDGILQPALANLTDSDTSNPTLSTTLTTINTISFTIPSWADEVTLMTFARLQPDAFPASQTRITNRLENDVGGLDQATDDNIHIDGNTKGSSMVALTTTVTSPGGTITCRQRAVLPSGATTLASEARLEGIAIVRRTS